MTQVGIYSGRWAVCGLSISFIGLIHVQIIRAGGVGASSALLVYAVPPRAGSAPYCVNSVNCVTHGPAEYLPPCRLARG
jgi:hypothetical protein